MGSGLIISGKRVPVAGLSITNYLDDPGLRLAKRDFRRRGKDEQWVRVIVLHTTRGIPGGKDRRPQDIRPGLGLPGPRAHRVVRTWAGDERGAGAHLIVDFDGQISCCADLATEATYHGGAVANGVSIGIEIVQGGAAELYLGQLEVVVKLCDALTRLFGIQRQCTDHYRGPSLRMRRSLRDVVGIVGHRDFDEDRDRGDPGDKIFYMLGAADYEPMNFDARLDLETWRRRQRDMGMAEESDGVPGPATVRALRQLGKPHGLWVQRPGDEGDSPVRLVT